MEELIILFVSAIGCHFYAIDFSLLYMFVSMALSLYKEWKRFTNDKTPNHMDL